MITPAKGSHRIVLLSPKRQTGETLRRLAAKLLLRKHLEDVLPSLLPHQVGVGVRGALDCVIHNLKAWASVAMPGHALLTIDFRNAFNEVLRSAMLRKVASDAPKFSAYAQYCYEDASDLRGDGFVLLSEEGTQQGDPCAPLFFALTLQTVLTCI